MIVLNGIFILIGLLLAVTCVYALLALRYKNHYDLENEDIQERLHRARVAGDRDAEYEIQMEKLDLDLYGPKDLRRKNHAA